MAKIKITVVKRLNFNDIHANSDLGCSANIDPVCDEFMEGQEFITDMARVPEGFCAGAFVDISRFVSGLRAGANYPWMNEKGKALVCCTDGFRTVVFRLERIAD